MSAPPTSPSAEAGATPQERPVTMEIPDSLDAALDAFNLEDAGADALTASGGQSEVVEESLSEQTTARWGDEPLDEEGDEATGPRLGSTPRGRAANLAVVALARAARSFVLYDPNNEAIRKFLMGLRDKVLGALAGFGTLTLDVRPFEFVLDREVVYLDRDRERSLAHRLYRDGVRRLTLDAEVTWQELLKLLEALSLRTTVAAAYEEDAVTLLRKASFAHIGLDAVEGYVPDEESPEEAADARRVAATKAHVEAPRDFDQPLPELQQPALVQYRPVLDPYREALRAEVAPGTLPRTAVRLLELLAEPVRDPTDPTTVEDVLTCAIEVREFLFIERDPSNLGALVGALRAIGGERALAGVFSDPKVLDEVVALIIERGNDDVLERDLLPGVTGPVMHSLLTRLRAHPSEAHARTILRLIRRFSADQAEMVAQAAAGGDAALLQALVPILRDVLPGHVQPLTMALLARPDPEAQRVALELLPTLPLGPGIVQHLLPLFRSSAADVRLSASRLVARLAPAELFTSLSEQVLARAGKDLGPHEAEAIGQTLARMRPEPAKELFIGWIRPKGFLQRLLKPNTHNMVQWVAVAGLGLLPGDDIEGAIRGLLQHVEDEGLRAHIHATLTRRRHREMRHG